MIKVLFRQKPPRFCFSEYFEKRDNQEIIDIYTKRNKDKRYLFYKNDWKHQLELKHRRRDRALELERLRTPPLDQQAKFLVHDPIKGIELPPSQLFAVCMIGARQYKVLKDDLVISEYLEGLDVNTTVEFDQVMLVGSKDFTVLGRPFVEQARVRATVEQQTLSEKEIIFKKRRRKRYMKSQGHRQKLTVLRINEIIHSVKEDLLKRAVSLI